MLSGMDVCLAKLNGFLEELIDLEYPKQWAQVYNYYIYCRTV